MDRAACRICSTNLQGLLQLLAQERAGRTAWTNMRKLLLLVLACVSDPVREPEVLVLPWRSCYCIKDGAEAHCPHDSLAVRANGDCSSVS